MIMLNPLQENSRSRKHLNVHWVLSWPTTSLEHCWVIVMSGQTVALMVLWYDVHPECMRLGSIPCWGIQFFYPSEPTATLSTQLQDTSTCYFFYQKWKDKLSSKRVNIAVDSCLNGLAVWCSPRMQETGVRIFLSVGTHLYSKITLSCSISSTMACALSLTFCTWFLTFSAAWALVVTSLRTSSARDEAISSSFLLHSQFLGEFSHGRGRLPPTSPDLQHQ